jgi:hypothetical protein
MLAMMARYSPDREDAHAASFCKRQPGNPVSR